MVSQQFIDRFLASKRTKANGTDPRHLVTVQRARSPMLYARHVNWDQVAAGTWTRSSVAMRREARYSAATKAYVAGINASGASVYTSMLTDAGPGVWSLEFTIAGAKDVALVFVGQFIPTPRGTVELITVGDPWVLWIDSSDNLKVQHWTGAASTLATGVKAVSGVMGVTSELGDISQGLIAFYALTNGTVFSRQYFGGVWETAAQVSGAPSSTVDVAAGRTWDYRIWLQTQNSSGAIHEMFSHSMISGLSSTERLDVHAIAETERTALERLNGYDGESGRISAVASASTARIKPSAPVLLSVANFPRDDGNSGYLIRLRFDSNVEGIDDNLAAFVLTDESDTEYEILELYYESTHNLIIARCADFNECDGDLTLTYTPGTLTGDVTAVEAFSETFTPTDLHHYVESTPADEAVEVTTIAVETLRTALDHVAAYNGQDAVTLTPLTSTTRQRVDGLPE